jgi:Tfp pilus assembly protein PilN
MAAFPNVAPQPFRAKRLPWKRILTVGLIGVPLLVLAAGGLVIGGVVLPRWRALEARKHLAETTLTQGQTRLVQERQQLQQLKGLETNQGAQPRWVRDLDALTRLLPEDSHLVGLRWDPEGIQIDLVTPNPELIRSILEAAPDFMEVRFQGNLDRHGDQSRLTLSLKPETPR